MSEQELVDIARTIVTQNLHLAAGESLLFFTDFNSVWEERFELLKSRRLFLHSFFEAFVALRSEFGSMRSDKYESRRRHGYEPGENIWRLAFGEEAYDELSREDLIWKLKGEVELSADEWERIRSLLREFSRGVVDTVVAFPWYSVTHTRFRRLLTESGTRFVSMPMLTASVMAGPMKADWGQVRQTTERIYRLLLGAKEVHVKCPNGTDLLFGVGGKQQIHKDTGDFSEPSTYGNLPAGEAYMVPAAKSTMGKLVLTSGPDFPVISPVFLDVRQGTVVNISGESDYAEELRRKFAGDHRIRHIAELGIGTNPLARDVSSMIEGEKIQGTIHVALGDDSGIGGENEATEHLDHVICNPTVVARAKHGDMITIIREGELLV
jgi:aminopeptidase